MMNTYTIFFTVNDSHDYPLFNYISIILEQIINKYSSRKAEE